jgi:hypothetical protein
MLIVWAFIFVVLAVVGLFIGIIIGFILFFFIIGGINTFLTSTIWSISVRSDWKSLLAHGFVFSILQIIVNIPAVLIQYALPDLAVIAVLFIIYSFIDGFLARKVAGFWEEGEEEYEEIGEQV